MLTESLYPCIMKMVSANVCRALPPATDDFDPEEDEPVLELSWPHLQVQTVRYLSRYSYFHQSTTTRFCFVGLCLPKDAWIPPAIDPRYVPHVFFSMVVSGRGGRKSGEVEWRIAIGIFRFQAAVDTSHTLRVLIVPLERLPSCR